MYRETYRAAAVAALALMGLTAACSGDTVLAAPDGSRCTAGTLRAGQAVTGEITADGCQLWSDYDYAVLSSESWTLRTAAGKVYVIRMKPIAVNGGSNTLDANVWVYGRNEAGDPVLLSGQNASFANPDGSGESATETVIPSHEAMTLSVRVTADAALDVGGYELSVSECPLREVELGVTSTALAFDDSCTMYTYGGLAPSPVAFFAWPGQAGVDFAFTATRTAGTANFRMSVRGPGTDFGCYTDDCQSALSNSGSGAGPISLFSTPSVDGGHTVVIGQAAAGTLTATLNVSYAGVVLRAPSTLQR